MDPDPLPADCMAGLLCDSAISFQAPPDWVAWSFMVLIAVICLMLSAFVSGSEIAFFGLTPHDVDEIEEGEDSKDKKASYLLNHSEQLLATILISNNLVNITMVVVLTFAINQVTEFHSTLVNFLVQTVFLTFLLLLFGEIFPKLVARGRTLWWVRWAAGMVTVFYKIFSPLSRMMVKSTTIVNKIITKKKASVTTDELEKALEISDVKEGDEKEMLEGILSFGEKDAHEIMISRVDVTAIESHDDWDEVIHIILDSGYSRIPVYDTDLDTIIGILYSKDLLPYLDREDRPRWQSLIRDAYFVPESRMIDDLLEDFRKRKIHIAIVIDEYGCTQGIVTLEDVIEQIVGDIDDEYDDRQSDMYRQIGPNSFIMDAKIPIEDFCEAVGIDKEALGDIGDAETLAGLLLEIKGDFPQPNELLRRANMRFNVLKMERHRIVEVKVVVDKPETLEKLEKNDKGANPDKEATDKKND